MFLMDRPPCPLPAPRLVTPWLPPLPTPKSSDRRSTSDKTGQATRLRWRLKLVARYGAVCHLCGLPIDLELRWPNPLCFVRDHVRPRSRGGPDTLRNQRPAHKRCNESRGNKPL